MDDTKGRKRPSILPSLIVVGTMRVEEEGQLVLLRLNEPAVFPLARSRWLRPLNIHSEAMGDHQQQESCKGEPVMNANDSRGPADDLHRTIPTCQAFTWAVRVGIIHAQPRPFARMHSVCTGKIVPTACRQSFRGGRWPLFTYMVDNPVGTSHCAPSGLTA